MSSVDDKIREDEKGYLWLHDFINRIGAWCKYRMNSSKRADYRKDMLGLSLRDRREEMKIFQDIADRRKEMMKTKKTGLARLAFWR